MAIKSKIKIDKNKINNPLTQRLLWCVGFFVMGLVTSLGWVVNDARPFGISLVAVAKKRHLLFALAGATVGYIAGGFNEQSARYIASILLASIGALGADVFDLRHNVAFLMWIAFLSNIASAVVLNIHVGAPATQYFLAVGEAVLSAGGVFFFYRSLNSSYKRLRLKALPITDLACIVVSVSIVLLNLSSLNIGIISPVRIVAIFAIMCGVRYQNTRWGMLLALCFGFVLSISSDGALFIVGALAFSTMVASLFCGYSHYAVGISFLCSIGFFAIASGEDMGLSLFLEALAGTLAVVLMPEKISQKLEKICAPDNDAPQNQSLRQNLVLKLRFASSAMAAISESVDQVREKINHIIRNENLQKKPFISDEEYLTNEIILEKTNQIRMVASDQFFSIAGMLEDLAFEFDEAETFDANASAKIRRLLGDFDIFPKNITAIEDKYARMRVEILVDSNTKNLSDPKLQQEIGKICNRYFEKGKITYFKNEAMLSFFEKPTYKLKVGFAQHSAGGKLCGDTVKVINDNKGHSILIISDGMGKGSRAALDGAMGAGLLSKLINAGFGFDSALKVVNSALLVKSNDESLATLDIANIDLFTGKCQLLKAGAPASYIIKDNTVTKWELTSMPAGILRGIEFAKRNAVLRIGDSIVLLSDGITDLGEEWLKGVLLSLNSVDVQFCADKILECALLECDNQAIDDMSVIYATLEM